jgi:hypothetical protein
MNPIASQTVAQHIAHPARPGLGLLARSVLLASSPLPGLLLP